MIGRPEVRNGFPVPTTTTTDDDQGDRRFLTF
jgi:hypothetical protein